MITAPEYSIDSAAAWEGFDASEEPVVYSLLTKTESSKVEKRVQLISYFSEEIIERLAEEFSCPTYSLDPFCFQKLIYQICHDFEQTYIEEGQDAIIAAIFRKNMLKEPSAVIKLMEAIVNGSENEVNKWLDLIILNNEDLSIPNRLKTMLIKKGDFQALAKIEQNSIVGSEYVFTEQTIDKILKHGSERYLQAFIDHIDLKTACINYPVSKNKRAVQLMAFLLMVTRKLLIKNKRVLAKQFVEKYKTVWMECFQKKYCLSFYKTPSLYENIDALRFINEQLEKNLISYLIFNIVENDAVSDFLILWNLGVVQEKDLWCLKYGGCLLFEKMIHNHSFQILDEVCNKKEVMLSNQVLKDIEEGIRCFLNSLKGTHLEKMYFLFLFISRHGLLKEKLYHLVLDFFLKKPLLELFLCRKDFQKALVLIEAGVGVTTINRKGWNALHVLASLDLNKNEQKISKRVCKSLFKQGCSLEEKNQDGLTPIMMAKNVSSVEVLRSLGAHLYQSAAKEFVVGHMTLDLSVTFLHLCICNNQKVILEYLLETSDVSLFLQTAESFNTLLLFFIKAPLFSDLYMDSFFENLFEKLSNLPHLIFDERNSYICWRMLLFIFFKKPEYSGMISGILKKILLKPVASFDSFTRSWESAFQGNAVGLQDLDCECFEMWSDGVLENIRQMEKKDLLSLEKNIALIKEVRTYLFVKGMVSAQLEKVNVIKSELEHFSEQYRSEELSFYLLGIFRVLKENDQLFAVLKEVLQLKEIIKEMFVGQEHLLIYFLSSNNTYNKKILFLLAETQVVDFDTVVNLKTGENLLSVFLRNYCSDIALAKSICTELKKNGVNLFDNEQLFYHTLSEDVISLKGKYHYLLELFCFLRKLYPLQKIMRKIKNPYTGQELVTSPLLWLYIEGFLPINDESLEFFKATDSQGNCLLFHFMSAYNFSFKEGLRRSCSGKKYEKILTSLICLIFKKAPDLLDKKDQEERTFFHLICMYYLFSDKVKELFLSNKKMVSKLLAVQDSYQQTPFQKAITHNTSFVIEFLLDYVNVFDTTDYLRKNILHECYLHISKTASLMPKIAQKLMSIDKNGFLKLSLSFDKEFDVPIMKIYRMQDFKKELIIFLKTSQCLSWHHKYSELYLVLQELLSERLESFQLERLLHFSLQTGLYHIASNVVDQMHLLKEGDVIDNAHLSALTPCQKTILGFVPVPKSFLVLSLHSELSQVTHLSLEDLIDQAISNDLCKFKISAIKKRVNELKRVQKITAAPEDKEVRQMEYAKLIQLLLNILQALEGKEKSVVVETLEKVSRASEVCFTGMVERCYALFRKVSGKRLKLNIKEEFAYALQTYRRGIIEKFVAEVFEGEVHGLNAIIDKDAEALGLPQDSSFKGDIYAEDLFSRDPNLRNRYLNEFYMKHQAPQLVYILQQQFVELYKDNICDTVDFVKKAGLLIFQEHHDFLGELITYSDQEVRLTTLGAMLILAKLKMYRLSSYGEKITQHLVQDLESLQEEEVIETSLLKKRTIPLENNQRKKQSKYL